LPAGVFAETSTWSYHNVPAPTLSTISTTDDVLWDVDGDWTGQQLPRQMQN